MCVYSVYTSYISLISWPFQDSMSLLAHICMLSGFFVKNMEIHKRNAIKNEKTVVDAFIQLSLVTYEAKSPKLIT